MVKIVFVICLVSTSLTAFAYQAPCPDHSIEVLKSLKLVASSGEPFADTEVSLEQGSNGSVYQRFKNASLDVTAEISEQNNGWHWVSVTKKTSGISSTQVGNFSQEVGASDTGYTFEGCKISTILSNRVKTSTNLIIQTSASAQFCRNLNAGKTPEEFGDHLGTYLRFDDNSGNIRAEREEETRIMCQDAAFLL